MSVMRGGWMLLGECLQSEISVQIGKVASRADLHRVSVSSVPEQATNIVLLQVGFGPNLLFLRRLFKCN